MFHFSQNEVEGESLSEATLFTTFLYQRNSNETNFDPFFYVLSAITHFVGLQIVNKWYQCDNLRLFTHVSI